MVSQKGLDDLTSSENLEYSDANALGSVLSKSPNRSKIVRSRLASTEAAQNATVLIYMNGSDLESDNGDATTDISEMLDASYSSNLNVVIQTMGTRRWQDYGISSNRSQRWLVKEHDLELVDDSLGQLDCTDPSTLADFITWGVSQYPADRYILLFWNHGGGPVYGFGYDEFNESGMLTTAEILAALTQAGTIFDFIGMDACIMSCMELCCAIYEYCDYAVLSEEFESSIGWSYAGWLDALGKDPSISTEALAKILIDDMVAANESSVYGSTATLALIDESKMKVLFTAWTDFAYANQDTLLGTNYSRAIKKSNRARPLIGFPDYDWGDYSYGEYDVSMSEYFITDILDVAQSIDSSKSAVLKAAVNEAIVYFGCTEDAASLSGISVTLPYGDSSFYKDLQAVLTACGFDETYISWLENFTSVSSNSPEDYYDYGGQSCGWDCYDYYDEDYYDWSTWDYFDDSDYWDDDWCDWGCDFDYGLGDWYGYDYGPEDWEEDFDDWFNSEFWPEYDDGESGWWNALDGSWTQDDWEYDSDLEMMFIWDGETQAYYFYDEVCSDYYCVDLDGTVYYLDQDADEWVVVE